MATTAKKRTKKHNKLPIECMIALQLFDAANEDDRLGRGEYELIEVEEGTKNQREFVIVAQDWDEGSEPKRFKVTVKEIKP